MQPEEPDTARTSELGTQWASELGDGELPPHLEAEYRRLSRRMLISVTPSGLERPFRENAALMKSNPAATPAQIEAIFNKYGVEFLGPPLSPTP